MTLFFITCGLGIMNTLAVYFAFRACRAGIRKSLGKGRSGMDSQVLDLDDAIIAAFRYAKTMVCYDEVIVLQKEVQTLATDLTTEKGKLEDLEQRLEKMHVEVDGKEGKHSELKKGKEEAEQMADQLRANTEQLKGESKRLETELTTSKEQMSYLSSEVNLTQEQKRAVEEVTRMLNNVSSSMKDLNEIYQQSRDRFVNLQQQYHELEKEYRKLVEKELSGT